MAKKIYLSTFALKVLDRKTETLLKTFDGKNDFLDIFCDFTEEIFKTVTKTHGFADKTTLHITLDKPVVTKKDNRVVYGYLSSGIGGDSFKVRSEGETQTKFESYPDTDITFRNLFFFLKIPLRSKFGYLVLQRKRDFAAKGSMQSSINSFLKNKGYENFHVGLYNLLNEKVFDKMISNGNLKNIDFIKKSIPKTIEELYSKGPKEDKGTLITSIKSKSSLSDYWKQFVKDLYQENYEDKVIEIQDGTETLDEIEFKLELKGKTKKFHILSKHKTWPDVEVSDDLDFVNNEPTEVSLAKVAEELIDDLLILKPNVSAN